MNIKGLLGPQMQVPIRATEKVGRAIHSDMTHDRDANGQQTFGDEKKQREPMTEEQLKKSVEQLEHLPAFKEHNWTAVLVEESDGKKFVLVKDNLGTVIRKIPEFELWSLNYDENSSKGHLLKKAA